MNQEEVEKNIKNIITQLGEDPDRQGLKDTPRRYAKKIQYLTSGYQMDLKKVINGAIFEESYSDMVIVRDIEFYSLCEHHMLPFYGKCHVGYIPNGRVIGLSKIPRIVDCFARRLQVQERLTNQVSEAIQEHLTPMGVGVVMEASHLCMMMRGVEKQSSYTMTSSMQGVFQTMKTREEFMTLVCSKGR